MQELDPIVAEDWPDSSSKQLKEPEQLPQPMSFMLTSDPSQDCDLFVVRSWQKHLGVGAMVLVVARDGERLGRAAGDGVRGADGTGLG